MYNIILYCQEEHMRKAGVLLHISTLPGEFGCGTFGKNAYRFASFLEKSGFSIWQVLPFNIPHKDACPYSSVSTFAQNPLFIDPEILQSKGLLTAEEVEEIKKDSAECIGDYYKLAKMREKQLRAAAVRFNGTPESDAARKYVNENPRIMQACTYLAKDDPTDENIFHYIFLQYEFFCQWSALHKYLSEHNIEVIGDIPIYADAKSSEVYYNPECFMLNSDGKAEFVSGVPGDSFNDAGQKWNHPLYNVEEMKRQNYSLMFDRMKFASSFYDVTRIDHFQAIALFYAIPANGHPRDGHWEKGVGEPFVKRLVDEIGKEKFVVEDFNSFPGGSYDLAMKYGFPDMNTLQFTLSAGKTADVYNESTVAYMGTHDNNTFVGYLDALKPEKLKKVASLLGTDETENKKELCRLGIDSLFASRAERVVLQLQDLLFEGKESRMNVPGISGHGNWMYRITEEKLTFLLESAANEWKEKLTKYKRLELN